MEKETFDSLADHAPELRKEVEALRRDVNRRDETIARLRDLMEALYHQLTPDNPVRLRVREVSDEILRSGPGHNGLDIAHEFQRRLLPQGEPRVQGVRIASQQIPAALLRGDIYDVFDMGAGCLGVFIGDVSSAGLPAALVMTIAKMSLRAGRAKEYSPAAVLQALNADLCRSALKSQFMTAFFGVLDTETSRLTYVNASHCAPILYGPGRFRLLEGSGAHCGMIEDTQYEEIETDLAPAEHLLLFSDGLVDALNARGKPYTLGRLHALIHADTERDAGALIEVILRDLKGHVENRELEDDVTLLGLDILPREVKEDCVIISTEPKLLPDIEDAIQTKLNECNFGQRSAFAVRLAVEEAVINAMKHGNHMDKAKTVTIRWAIDDRRAVIVVEDEGEGFDPAAVPDPTEDENLEMPHGRGLVLIRAYMDEVLFNEKGNQITMIKQAPWLTDDDHDE